MENVFVRLSAEDEAGYGEASPNAFYGESAPDVLARLKSAAPWVATLELATAEDVQQAWRDAWSYVAPSRAAQCALDLAFWDWLAKRKGVTVAELALGKLPHPVQTFCTLGLSEQAEMERKVEELRGFPLIKIKSDARADLAVVRFVRERSGAKLAVDANGAWTAHDIAQLSRELALLGVAFIEQPLHPQEDARMAEWHIASELPLMADESCVISSDVERLEAKFDGFNIKLVKCGGLTPALAMLRRGREFGLHMMAGCMLESSLLIAAGAVVAQETEYADLDGAWLLADDPFSAQGGGVPLREGTLYPPTSPGFGVEPVAGLFLP